MIRSPRFGFPHGRIKSMGEPKGCAGKRCNIVSKIIEQERKRRMAFVGPGGLAQDGKDGRYKEEKKGSMDRCISRTHLLP